MPMNPDNIFSGPVHVYLAIRSDRDTQVDHATNEGWIDHGSLDPASVKYKTTPNKVKVQTGEEHMKSIKLDYELSALETDNDKVAELEAGIGKRCDLLLVQVGGVNAKKLIGVSYCPVENGDASETGKVSIDVTGSVIGRKSSDVINNVTLDWSL